jgi:hypothetical protein
MDLKLALNSPDAIDEVSPSLHRIWYANRRIVAYELFDISQTIANEWASLAIETIHAWPSGQPYLALHNISQRGIAMKAGWLHASLTHPAITDFGKKRLFLNPADEADFVGRIAVVVSLQNSGNFARVLVNQRSTRQLTDFLKHKFFSEKEAALHWLSNGLN